MRAPFTLSVGILTVFNVDHHIVDYESGFAPFDSYVLQIMGFAIEKATNKSVPIINFAAGDGPDNYLVSSDDYTATNIYTYDPGTGPTTVVADSRFVLDRKSVV